MGERGLDAWGHLWPSRGSLLYAGPPSPPCKPSARESGAPVSLCVPHCIFSHLGLEAPCGKPVCPVVAFLSSCHVLPSQEPPWPRSSFPLCIRYTGICTTVSGSPATRIFTRYRYIHSSVHARIPVSVINSSPCPSTSVFFCVSIHHPPIHSPTHHPAINIHPSIREFTQLCKHTYIYA